MNDKSDNQFYCKQCGAPLGALVVEVDGRKHLHHSNEDSTAVIPRCKLRCKHCGAWNGFRPARPPRDEP